MVAISFINKTRKSKFKGTFKLDAADYEYTMYLLPITKQKEYDEIVDYFGNRMFKGSVCLDVDETAVEDYLNNDDVSAFIMVNPVNTDNVASGTLQIYDWCNTSSASSSKSQNPCGVPFKCVPQYSLVASLRLRVHCSPLARLAQHLSERCTAFLTRFLFIKSSFVKFKSS